MGAACSMAWICHILDVQKSWRTDWFEWKNDWSLVYFFCRVYMCYLSCYLETHFRNHQLELYILAGNFYFIIILLGNCSLLEYKWNSKSFVAISKWNIQLNSIWRSKSLCCNDFYSFHLPTSWLLFKLILMAFKTLWNSKTVITE